MCIKVASFFEGDLNEVLKAIKGAIERREKYVYNIGNSFDSEDALFLAGSFRVTPNTKVLATLLDYGRTERIIYVITG